ncbi:unnamed protein product [Rotaria sp. Silwood1]|nr:unnamed protein product [Rotaria sp. Silwood1]
MIELIRNLNLFPAVPPSTDSDTLRNERIATKLFIILLILGTFILSLYTYFTIVIKTVHVKNPTVEQYTQLYSQYSQKLTCPCSKVSIKYEKIINVTVTFHQVCTSDFISELWLKYMKSTAITLYFADFRRFSIYTFQTLQILCRLVNKTISANLDDFYSDQYISTSTTPQNLLRIQIDSLFARLIISMENSFLQTFQLIRSTTYQNVLTSAALTDHYHTDVDLLGIPLSFIVARSNIWSNCDCAVKATCIQSAAIYNITNNRVLYTVSGMYIGCYLIEATLQSTLECLYNKTCLDMITSHVTRSLAIDWIPLNSSQSQNLANETIQAILDQLMVQKWNWSINYDSYYTECQPYECMYTYESRNDAIYIVTTIIGLVGGLTTALNLGILKIALPILKYTQRKKRRIIPIMSFQTNEASKWAC